MNKPPRLLCVQHLETMNPKPKKKPERFVNVDMGYQTAEHWVKAKVISESMTSALFDNRTVTNLLVELPGGERTWVDWWKEIV